MKNMFVYCGVVVQIETYRFTFLRGEIVLFGVTPPFVESAVMVGAKDLVM
jgi:hypothetical protein